MVDHQALVSSTWDADQIALRDWVDCIVKIQHENVVHTRINPHHVIWVALKTAYKADDHCSLSSFLATVHEKLWCAAYCPLSPNPRGEFRNANPASGLPRLPSLPILFRGNLDVILAQGKKQCLVQVIHDFVSDKYLEQKYAKTLLKPVWPLPAALEERRSLQDEFNRQLQQKKAAVEKSPQASTTEVSAIQTKQAKGPADGEASDVEMDDLEKSMENAKDEVSRANISKRLIEWRVKKLWSMLEPASSQDGYWTGQDVTLRTLRDFMSADIGAYRALRQFIVRLKKTEAGKWYCVRAIGIDPGTFRDAERIEDRANNRRTICNKCRGAGSTCLQFESIGGRKGATKVVFAVFST